ncbi:tyrosine-type recombinase/integrase [Amycolatopsis australiensis]|uniref:tyrosine-type recombinase/integrase n=1 Tax=Amycolatopsis australiensis TaxID=546364 RepID=UPI003CCC1F96
MNRRDEAIIRLIRDTGGRLSEIANIDMERDLDPQRRVVNVLGTGGRWRALPFTPATGKAIARYIRVRSRHPHADSAARLWLGEHRRRTPLSDNGIKIMLRRRGRAAGAQGETRPRSARAPWPPLSVASLPESRRQRGRSHAAQRLDDPADGAPIRKERRGRPGTRGRGSYSRRRTSAGVPSELPDHGRPPPTWSLVPIR